MPKGLDRAYSATAEQGHRPSMQCVPALVQHAGITTTAAQRQRQSMHRDDKQLRLCVATANQHHRETYASRRQERQTMQGYNGATAGTTNASRWRRVGESMHRNIGETAATVHAPRRQEQRADYALQRQINGSEIACIATARARNTMHRYGGATAATSMHRDGESRADYA